MFRAAFAVAANHVLLKRPFRQPVVRRLGIGRWGARFLSAQLIYHLGYGFSFTKSVLIREPLAVAESFTLDSFGERLRNAF